MSGPYDYASRDGMVAVDWNMFVGLCKGLALAVEAYNPDVIVGVARGGLYPATQLSHLLQTDLMLVQLSRRVKDEVVHASPIWQVKPGDLHGKRVLVVDEIADTGETLALVAAECQTAGAAEVRTATLYAHTQSQDSVDYIGIVTDQLIFNPWDREVLQRSTFVPHPEYVGAIQQQDNTQVPLLGIDTITPTKS